MKKIITTLFIGLLFGLPAAAKPVPAPAGGLTVREIHYAATLSDDEARFTLDIAAEAPARAKVL